MRRMIFWITMLTVIDQAVKLLIAHFLMDAQFTIIPGVLSFYVSQNIHLGWIWVRLNIMMPLHFAVIITIVQTLVVIIYIRFISYATHNYRKFQSIPGKSMMLILTGSVCKLIDDIFWGGSLDFLEIFDWFIFDIKDIYITIGLLLLFVCIISNQIWYYGKLTKKERQIEKLRWKFINWFKSGMTKAGVGHDR